MSALVSIHPLNKFAETISTPKWKLILRSGWIIRCKHSTGKILTNQISKGRNKSIENWRIICYCYSVTYRFYFLFSKVILYYINKYGKYFGVFSLGTSDVWERIKSVFVNKNNRIFGVGIHVREGARSWLW